MGPALTWIGGGTLGILLVLGSAVVAVSGEMRKRLWARVQEGGGPPPKPLVGRVRTLKGEGLRHASLKDFRERDDAV